LRVERKYEELEVARLDLNFRCASYRKRQKVGRNPNPTPRDHGKELHSFPEGG